MSKVPERDLEKKFQEMFEQSELPNRMDNLHNTMMEMDPEEQAEVKEHLAKLMEKKEAKKPKWKWLWSFKGVFLFRTLLYVVEFLILITMMFFLLPLSINTTVTVTQVVSGAILLTFLRQWWTK